MVRDDYCGKRLKKEHLSYRKMASPITSAAGNADKTIFRQQVDVYLLSIT